MSSRSASLSLWVLSIAAFLSAAAGAAWFFQDAIGLWMINPNRSYEAYTPPPPPDYRRQNAWLARRDGRGQADIFFIHSNVYHGDGNWNAPYDRDTQLPFLRDVLLPLEAGPFAAQGTLWAPRYRQPTLYARFTQKHPGAASRDTGYRDISAAFEAFLEQRDLAKPFIVAGYGDGALLAAKLWRERIEPDPALKEFTAAVYAIGMPLPARMFDGQVCQAEDEPRCLLGFAPVDERYAYYQERLREKTLTLSESGGWISTSRVGKLCATPPLPPVVDAAYTDDGALRFLPTELKTRCESGLLVVTPPEDKRLRGFRFFGLQWRPDRINLFYKPLEEDARARVNGALRTLAKEAMIAPPLAAPIEIEESEINVVPDNPPTD